MATYDLSTVDDDNNSGDNYTSTDFGFFGVGDFFNGLALEVKHLNTAEAIVSGTGVYTPFLHVDTNGPTTLGFNTDEKTSTQAYSDAGLGIADSSTQALRLGDVPIVYLDLDGNGTAEAYYELRLDINEPNNTQRQVSLEELQIYTSSSQATIADYHFDEGAALAFENNPGNAATDFVLRFDLDAGGDRTLILQDNSNGSGRDDYIFYLPLSTFSGASPSDYFTVFSQFGPNPGEDGGFEEWRIQTASKIVGIKFEDTNGNGVQDNGEQGLGGFVMYIDANNNNQLDAGEVSTTSASDGTFTFYSLLGSEVGTAYTIREAMTAQQNANYRLTTGNAEGDHIVTITTAGNYVVSVGNQPVIKDFTVVKTITSVTGGVGPSGLSANNAGDVINYKVVITNTGNVSLTNVQVTDLLEGGGYPVGTVVESVNQDGVLQVGETWTYNFAYTLTQADFDNQAGGDRLITNAASASAEYNGETISRGPSTVITPIIYDPRMAIDKIVLQIYNPDGTVDSDGIIDQAGDRVEYQVVVSNTGNVTLTGVVTTDPLLGGIIGGPTTIAVGGSVTYSGSYVVTQQDLDTRGDSAAGNDNADGDLDNTASADSNETAPVSDSEEVPMLYNPSFSVLKQVVSVTGGTGLSVNSAGDVINYQITVQNTGNITLTGFTYSDANADGDTITLVSGDTDNDGDLDVGETWLFSAAHTVDQAEIDGRGTGANGTIDGDGDVDNTVTVDFAQVDPKSSSVSTPILILPGLAIAKDVTAIAGGIGANGLGGADTAGDVIHYSIVLSNTGNVALTGITVSDPNADPGSIAYVSGDADGDGKLDVGETWSYTATHTVTQGELDSRGDGDGDVDNTATADSLETNPVNDDASAPLVYDPKLAIDKVVVDVDGQGADASADAAGDVITYRVSVTNTGNVTLTNVTVKDPLTGLDVVVSSLAVGETWTSDLLTYAVTQADLDGKGGGDGDIDNTATADSDQTGPGSDSEDVPLVYDPKMAIDKQFVSVTGGNGNTVADWAGDVINYTILVSNEGNITLTGITVTDPNATTLVRSTDLVGDNDDLLEVGEVWSYAATHTVTQDELDGKGGGDGDVDNTATADSNETPPSDDSVEVPLVYDPKVDVEKYVQVNAGAGYGAWEDADNPKGPETSFNTAVNFRVVISNTGNITLSGITLVDKLTNYATNTTSNLNYTSLDAWVDLNNNGSRDGNESWSTLDANGDGTLDNVTLGVGSSLTVYYSLPFESGQHTNTVFVTTSQNAGDNDAANYYGIVNTGPGVRTPGFWSNWMELWDGNLNTVPKQQGTTGFADHDLLFVNADGGPTGSGAGANNGYEKLVTYNGVVGLLVGDFNRNGVQDNGEDVLFISLTDAQNLINASKRTSSADGVQILGRDLVATWLNYLAGNGIDNAGTSDDGANPKHFIQDAVDWLQTFGGTDHDGPADTFDVYSKTHTAVRTSSGWWSNPTGDIDHSAAAMHTALDTYNNTGTINSVWYAGSADDPAFLLALSQVGTV